MGQAGTLAGKRVLITGGAKRIGREIALSAARSGADVAITFRESADAAAELVAHLQGLGIRAFAVHCDVREQESVRDALAESVSKLGGMDVLVNNAGRFQTANFEEITIQEWDDVFNTNARGPFLMSQAALPELRKAGGRIIHVGSLGGIRPWATHAHYCASKAALHMLTQVMAKALAPQIAVNCVAPGMIQIGDEGSAAFARSAEKTPMRTNGTTADVASAVLYFAAAPKFITGQILTVDGGLSLV